MERGTSSPPAAAMVTAAEASWILLFTCMLLVAIFFAIAYLTFVDARADDPVAESDPTSQDDENDNASLDEGAEEDEEDGAAGNESDNATATGTEGNETTTPKPTTTTPTTPLQPLLRPTAAMTSSHSWFVDARAQTPLENAFSWGSTMAFWSLLGASVVVLGLSLRSNWIHGLQLVEENERMKTGESAEN